MQVPVGHVMQNGAFVHSLRIHARRRQTSRDDERDCARLGRQRDLAPGGRGHLVGRISHRLCDALLRALEQAAAPHSSLAFMFWGEGLFILPLMLLYTVITYRVFRGKASTSHRY